MCSEPTFHRSSGWSDVPPPPPHPSLAQGPWTPRPPAPACTARLPAEPVLPGWIDLLGRVFILRGIFTSGFDVLGLLPININ